MFTLLTVALGALFIQLGRWQWHRGEARQAQWARFDAGAERVVPLGARGVDELPQFQRTRLVGRLDPDHQFLLDNRTYQGRAGFEVLTPLIRPNGRTLLLDRGWVPFSGRRDRLPDVGFPASGELSLVGRISDLPSAGLASGRAPPPPGDSWPKVTSYPTMAQLSTALGEPLEPRIILLDGGQGPGYVRDWKPPGLEPIRHWSYAVQWWSFAVVLVVIWAVLSTPRAGESG